MSAHRHDEAASISAQRLTCGGVATLLRHNPAHEAVTVRLYARGGASAIPVARAGSDLLYARAARRGTRRFPKQQLNAELAAMGTEIGAAVSEDATVFHVKCLRRHFERSWELFADYVFEPRLEEGEIELVRRQMLLHVRQRQDDADARLADLARELAYEGHPYASHPEGFESSVAGLTAEATRRHMQQQLRRANVLLVVAGRVEAETLDSVAASTFAPHADGDPACTPAPPLQFDSGRLRVEARELPTNYIFGQFAAPALSAVDYPATLLALSVLRDRLFEEVRTKRNLSYAPSAGLGNRAANLGWIYVTAVDPATTMQVMRAEMCRLRDEPLEAKELRDKVEVYITRYYMQNETSQAQGRFLANYELFGGGWERSVEFVSSLESLTPDDVQRAAQNVLRNIQYSYLGDASLANEAVLGDP